VLADEYGYATFSTTVDLTYESPTELRIDLTWEPARIQGILSPANANLRVDGATVTVAPTGSFSINLSAGEHTFTATAWSYVSFSKTVELEPSQYEPLGIHLTPANGTLRATISPATASVQVDGVPEATQGGVLNAEVPWGPDLLTASAAGFSPGQIVVNVSYNASVSAVLALAVAPGWIAGNVSPQNASVLLNGVPINVSASGSFNLTAPPGSYVVNASVPGFQSRSLDVVVRSGTTVSAQIELAPIAASGAPAMVRPLSLSVLSDGLELDAAVLAGIAGLFLLARRRDQN
jgi:hypothetical protein